MLDVNYIQSLILCERDGRKLVALARLAEGLSDSVCKTVQSEVESSK